MSAAAIAEAAQAIAKAIKEKNERTRAEEWKSDVTSKINLIVTQNAQIIALLKGLFLFIPDELERFFNNEAVVRSRELVRQFDVYMASRPPNVRGIRDMRDESERAAFSLLERGPSVYQAANAAALFVLAVYKVAGNVSVAETRNLIDQVVDQMKVWLSNDPGMFGAALDAQKKIISDNLGMLRQIPRGREKLHETWGSIDLGGDIPRTLRCNVALYTNIQIDETNLTRSAIDPEIEDSCGGEVSIRSDVVQQHIQGMRRRIDSLFAVLGPARANQITLETHIAALHVMIPNLQQLRP